MTQCVSPTTSAETPKPGKKIFLFSLCLSLPPCSASAFSSLCRHGAVPSSCTIFTPNHRLCCEQMIRSLPLTCPSFAFFFPQLIFSTAWWVLGMSAVVCSSASRTTPARSEGCRRSAWRSCTTLANSTLRYEARNRAAFLNLESCLGFGFNPRVDSHLTPLPLRALSQLALLFHRKKLKASWHLTFHHRLPFSISTHKTNTKTGARLLDSTLRVCPL